MRGCGDRALRGSLLLGDGARAGALRPGGRPGAAARALRLRSGQACGRLVAEDVAGRQGWRARYVKEVDSSEQAVRFYQEIYDSAGRLVEVHEKYPIDRGHRQVTE